MRIDFRALPGEGVAIPRPVVDVRVEGIERAALGCLVDTGTLHNRFDIGVARLAGLDLAGVPAESLGVGGRSTIGRTVAVGLRLGEFSWEAPVTFCDPWPWDFQLLGQEGFLRWFTVVLEVADRRLDVQPSA